MLDFKNKIHLVLFGIISISITFLLFISTKGFNYVDEGYYAFMTNPLQTISFSPINLDLFFKKIFQISRFVFDIQGLRYLRIIIIIIGSICMFLTISQISLYFQYHIHDNKSVLLFVILVGILSSYNLSFQTPGYNEYSIFGIQIFSGFISLVILNGNIKIGLRIICYLFAAFGFFILYLSKPTGLPFLVLYNGLLVVMVNKKVNYIETLIFGSIVALLFLTIPFESRISIWNQIKVFQIFQASSVNHSFINIAVNLGKGLFLFFITFLTSFLGTKKNGYSNFKNWLSIATHFLLVIMLFLFFRKKIMTSKNQFDFLIEHLNHFASLIFAYILGFFAKKYNSKKNEFFLFFLAGTLFMASFFGTDGALLISIPKSFQFFIIVFLPFSGKRNFLLAIFLTILLFIKMGLTLLFPIGQYSLLDQKVNYKYGSSNKSVLNLDSLQWINQMEFNKAISKFPDLKVLGFDRLQSYVYLSGKLFPGSLLWGDEDLNDYFKYRFDKPNKFILAVKNGQEFKLSNFLKDYKIVKYQSVKIQDKNLESEYISFHLVENVAKF